MRDNSKRYKRNKKINKTSQSNEESKKVKNFTLEIQDSKVESNSKFKK